jgi:putative transposase
MFLHVYNRGVEKRKIFLDEDDQEIFLYYLFIYLAPPERVKEIYPKLRGHLLNGNLFTELKLLSYCLMPNHFHFLLHQTQKDSTQKFLKRLTNAYTLYFNTKYKRVGGLFQGRYKAIAVETDEYLLHLSRYIHQNPIKINFVLSALRNYPWSSYPYYLHQANSDFLNRDFILNYFSNQNPNLNYQSFVETASENSLPTQLTLEED